MSSRKNGYGPDARVYISLEDEYCMVKDYRKQVAALDKKIEELEDEIDKLNKINMTLRDALTAEIYGLTDEK